MHSLDRPRSETEFTRRSNPKTVRFFGRFLLTRFRIHDVHVGTVANGNAHVGAPTKLDAAITRTQAKEALVGLGWKPAIAQAAVAAASAGLAAEVKLEPLIFEALRRCPRPTS